MTRDEAKKRAPVIQAWGEGRTIQFKRENVWDDVNNPSWIEGVEYRIKPEPREWWLVRYRGRATELYQDEWNARKAYDDSDDAEEVFRVMEATR